VVSDEELAQIRGKRSYRTAIWLARLNVIPVVLTFWLAPGDRTTPAPWVLALVLLIFALIVTGLLLARRAGVPFRGFGPFQGVHDPRMVWQICKDFFWFRRPESE